MDKSELQELYDLLDKFHCDDEMIKSIGGFQGENDEIIADALNIVYEALERAKET